MTGHVIRFPNALAAWGGEVFAAVLRHELEALDHAQLPLQAGLAHSSHVADSPFSAVYLDAEPRADLIRARCGIFYAGIIAGSCCADDPSPLCEQPEYCELQVDIDRRTAVARITLLR